MVNLLHLVMEKMKVNDDEEYVKLDNKAGLI